MSWTLIHRFDDKVERVVIPLSTHPVNLQNDLTNLTVKRRRTNDWAKPAEVEKAMHAKRASLIGKTQKEIESLINLKVSGVTFARILRNMGLTKKQVDNTKRYEVKEEKKA